MALLIAGVTGSADAADGRPDIVWMRGGHSAAVADVAYSPDGKMLATAGVDRTAKVWRVSDRQLVHTLVPYITACSVVAFSPNSAWLAVGTDVENGHDTSAVKVYKTQQFTEVLGQIYSHDEYGGVGALAFSPQGDYLAVAVPGFVELYRTSDWKRARTVTFPGDDIYIDSLSFSRDGSKLLVAQINTDVATLFLWSMSEERFLWPTNLLGGVRAPATFAPGDQELLWGLQLRSVQDGSLLRTLGVHNVNSVVFSPDGSTVAFTSWAAEVEFWDWASGTLRFRLGSAWGNKGLSFSPDGQFLTASGINVWRTSDGLPQRGFNEHAGKIDKIVFSPDDTLLASSGSDSTVRLWSVATGERVAVLPDYLISAMAFSPDSSLVIASSGLWSTNGTLVRRLNHPFGGVSDAAFSPDGRFVAVSYSGPIVVFDVTTGDPTTNGPYRLGVVSPNGAWSAWYSRSSGLMLNGQSIEPSSGATPKAMAFAADSGTLLVNEPGPTLKFWGVTSYEVAQTYTEEVAGGTPYLLFENDRVIGGWRGATAVAYSSNGQYFAYGRVDGTVVLARNQFATPVQMSARAEGGAIRLSWGGGNRYYVLQRRNSLSSGEWETISPPIVTTNALVTPGFGSPASSAFYRVQNLGN